MSFFNEHNTKNMAKNDGAFAFNSHTLLCFSRYIDHSTIVLQMDFFRDQIFVVVMLGSDSIINIYKIDQLLALFIIFFNLYHI